MLVENLMARPSSSSNNNTEKLVNALITTSREAQTKVSCPKPTLKAASVAGLRQELRLFQRFCSEGKIESRKQWIKMARNVCSGNALAEMEYFISHEFGGEVKYRRMPLAEWIQGGF